MIFKDPECFSEFLKPVGGNVLIRPEVGTSFHAEINMKRLENIGLFSVSSDSFKAEKEPSDDFFWLTIPLSNSFIVKQNKNIKQYELPMAHMLIPETPFQMSARKNAHFLVSTFFLKPINEYEKKLLQSDSSKLASISTDIFLHSHSGGILLTNIARAWSVLNNESTINPIALKELEDNLFSSLIFYSKTDDLNNKNNNKSSHIHLIQAEEYINESLKTAITRAQLAEISTCSIRTLSRQFEKKYGMGPMEYIKHLRLNSAYLELLCSDHRVKSVTKIATSFGFSHLGKFSIAFKNKFGESPSITLAK